MRYRCGSCCLEGEAAESRLEDGSIARLMVVRVSSSYECSISFCETCSPNLERYFLDMKNGYILSQALIRYRSEGELSQNQPCLQPISCMPAIEILQKVQDYPNGSKMVHIGCEGAVIVIRNIFPPTQISKSVL